MDTKDFHDRGYIVARGMLAPHEADLLREEFTRLHAAGPVPGHFSPKPQEPGLPYDGLRAYPRIMHPHQINDVALRYLLDARIAAVLRELLEEEPIAAQSMFYFKPPGARGQALHQDNFYLRVEPGTCVAAWIAVDRVDRANGGLEVVPGTHKMDLFCPEDADSSISFTREYVPPPPGLERVPVDMEPGDVLFFNGSLVHGSGPNATADRFRRSLIFHYAGRSAERIAAYYPTLTMAGAPHPLPAAEGGGPCGTEASGPH
ncbi:phytanoyl-CoA dioxygenase family protein [Nonomuraea endophytica]|uniref:Phytanoyl-CoA dioxygenase family protein n=1 Tax=Nonomuraea endophytica TaxID=714136 RepID=A0A7W8A1J4_9ACTN|nr:phytanoyl-CoA dioxygenase family protein [Nonomuraea endophytica]MBB5077872.1 hypothetical protein [Nonomuraea endophytica]